jgi:hypothetical protein
MCLRFAFLLITRMISWLQLSRREGAWQAAEILILRHQLAGLQRRQPRRPLLTWADRALLAALLSVIPKARRQGLRLLVTPDTILRRQALKIPLAPKRHTDTTWRQFLHAQAATMLATDFVTWTAPSASGACTACSSWRSAPATCTSSR